MNKKREMWKNTLNKLDEKYISEGATIAPEKESEQSVKNGKSGNLAFALAAMAAVVCCIAGVAVFGGNMREVPVNPASCDTVATEESKVINADEITDEFNIELTKLQTLQAETTEIIAAYEKKIGQLQAERAEIKERKELYEQKLKELNAETEAKIAAEAEKNVIEAMEKERLQLEEAKEECEKNYEELLKAEEKLVQAKADWEEKYTEVAEEENAVTEAMEEYATVETDEPLIFPAFDEKFILSPPVQPMTITTYYGYDCLRDGFSSGIDIGGEDFAGKDVCAAADGVVEQAVTSYTSENDVGKYITIIHENGYKTLYQHLDSVYVTVGQEVKRGDVIGTVGNTGLVTGYCLHFELINQHGKYLDPSWYFEKGTMKRRLTTGAVADIVKAKNGNAVTWADFDDYCCNEIGHGLYILRFDIEENLWVVIGGSHPDEAPWYAYLKYENNGETVSVDLNDYTALIQSGKLPLAGQ